MSPLCESFLHAEQLEADGAVLSRSMRSCCERCCLVQLEAFVPPDEIFTEYAYFSAYSTAWVEHARQYVEMIRARLELGPGRPRRRARVQRRLPPAALRRHRDPGPRHRSGRERRRGGGGARRADARRVLRPRDRASGSSRRASARASIVGNNVLAQVPDLNDFVAGVQDPPARRRHGDVRVPAPAAPARRAPVRHDLPRALLVLLVRDDRARSSRAHGLEVYDVEELWTHGGSLRVYAQHAGGPHAVERRRRRAARARGRRAGCARRSATRASPRT